MFFFLYNFCILARPLSSSADVKTRGFVSLMVADSCEPVQVGGWGQNGGFSCYGNGAAHFFFSLSCGKTGSMVCDGGGRCGGCAH